MKHTFTPGPWAIREGYGLLKAEVGPDNLAVATVWTKKMKPQKGMTLDLAVLWPEGQANARLIAAAPELLEALRPLVAMVNGADVGEVKRQHYLEQARAAIAKATNPG